MKEFLELNDFTWQLYEEGMEELESIFDEVDEICEYNSAKVMHAFFTNKISETHFGKTTGYGYNDYGRDAVEKVYQTIFKTESALVRNQFISGSHALCKTLFGHTYAIVRSLNLPMILYMK